MPQLWVIAGPNGAGKSTLTQQYFLGRVPLVNPDEIARTLDAVQPTRMRVQAGRAALLQQEALLAQDANFAMETTLAGTRELGFLRRAKTRGYKVSLIDLGVETPDIAVGRIRQRVAAGGHAVPLVDVDRRYARSLAPVPLVFTVVDRVVLCDNTGTRLRLIVSWEGGRLKSRSPRAPAWVHAALPPALQPRPAPRCGLGDGPHSA